MSDPREAQRERDLHELFVARGEFAAAFTGVPDSALGYRSAPDGYAVSGIVVDVTATLDHYMKLPSEARQMRMACAASSRA